jgi:hypothetical protein
VLAVRRHHVSAALLSAITLGLGGPVPHGMRLPGLRHGNKYRMGHDAGIRNTRGPAVRGKARNRPCRKCGRKLKRCMCYAVPSSPTPDQLAEAK